MTQPRLATSLIALLALHPALAVADNFEAPATISEVTIYPQGATVIRQLTIDLPAGQHDVVVLGLPVNTYAGSLRVTPSDGARIGAVSLATGRLPVTADIASPEVIAAKAEIARLEQVLRDHDTAVATIQLRVTAAEEQIAFLRSLAGPDALANADLERIRDLTALVGEQVLAARSAALAAQTEAQNALRARVDDADLLVKAQQALAALTQVDDAGAALSIAVRTDVAGPVTLTIATLVDAASWAPVYDMRLTTGDTPVLEIDRAVVVSQQTGEDWNGVALHLSTSRPGGQSAASEVYGQLRRIYQEQQMPLQSSAPVTPFAADQLVKLEPQSRAATAMTATQTGLNLTYIYDGAVDIRDGVDSMRLTLDTKTITPDVWAAAAPIMDMTAFMMAGIVNTTQETLLPGEVMLMADGAFVGYAQLPLIAEGADATLGFGPIDGLQLTRTTLNRSAGDVGMISRSNQQVEATQISVENLTGQAWPVRLRDVAPYSEQDDLEITISASLPVTTRDPDGRRGVLEWRFDLDAGQTQKIDINQTLTWPIDYLLE